jgi:tetratricopeptide (TPR) repeat protein
VKPALADTSRTPFDEPDGLDLPAPAGRGPSLDLDLPAMKGSADLPAPKGAPAKSGDGRVLAAADRAFGDLDLPMPKRAGAEAADLPRVAGETDLPALRDGADLPVPRAGADLPRKAPADLPALPPDGGAGAFPDLDLPPPRKAPSAAAAPMGDLDLPPPRARGGAAPAADDDLALPPPRKAGGARMSASELELPVPDRGPARGHGEIDLPDAPRDDMEFADIPEERGAAPKSAAAPRATGLDVERPKEVHQKTLAKPVEVKPRSRRGIFIALGIIVVVGAAGGALSLTHYGPFGYYAIEQYLPGAGDAATVNAAIANANEQVLHDTPSSYREALTRLATTRRTAGLNRALLARSLYVEAMEQLRFGTDAGGASRAAAIRERIERRDPTDPSVALGLGAEQLRLGHATVASTFVARARAFAPSDPFVDLLDGEIALANESPADANQAFQAARDHGGGAAASWGLARALSHGEDLAAYDAAIAATLEAAPDHVEALYARAMRLHATGDDTQALTLASQVVGREPLGEATLVSHAFLRAEAWSLLGTIFESRGRVNQALDAYAEASHADSNDVAAVLGEGRMLLTDRPADALSRFEAVIGASAASELTLPDGRTATFEARLGAARAMAQLDRVQEAHTNLQALAEERPNDAEVQLALGRVEEQLEHPEQAEQHYRESLRIAPAVFEPYLALARLYDHAQRTSDAVAVLESARSAVPQTAQTHEDLGSYELAQSRLPDAETEFRAALAMDANLPGARFGLGVTLRREGRLDDAEQAFDALALIDAGHPGLALERGQLFEARGQADRAVEYYRAALAERPNDHELELRLGGAQIAAGDFDGAATTLAPVLNLVPPRAEAEHFAGRIAFAHGEWVQAKQHFDRAISLDSTRGEFYMWAGWDALMANEIGLAVSRSDQALEHDPSLGDAYYVRGEARRRSGAVRDALTDLQRAIELRPTRYEALAAMGSCYDDLRQLPNAIDWYQRAVTAVDTNGEWWYRLGRLQLDANRTRDSVHSLSRATTIGDQTTPRPGWLADAHRVLGDGLRLSGERASAIQHYQTYLQIAPASAIDRDDVRSALLDLGAVPRGSP